MVIKIVDRAFNAFDIPAQYRLGYEPNLDWHVYKCDVAISELGYSDEGIEGIRSRYCNGSRSSDDDALPLEGYYVDIENGSSQKRSDDDKFRFYQPGYSSLRQVYNRYAGNGSPY